VPQLSQTAVTSDSNMAHSGLTHFLNDSLLYQPVNAPVQPSNFNIKQTRMVMDAEVPLN
jgi:hypothetical protein